MVLKKTWFFIFTFLHSNFDFFFSFIQLGVFEPEPATPDFRKAWPIEKFSSS